MSLSLLHSFDPIFAMSVVTSCYSNPHHVFTITEQTFQKAYQHADPSVLQALPKLQTSDSKNGYRQLNLYHLSAFYVGRYLPLSSQGITLEVSNYEGSFVVQCFQPDLDGFNSLSSYLAFSLRSPSVSLFQPLFTQSRTQQVTNSLILSLNAKMIYLPQYKLLLLLQKFNLSDNFELQVQSDTSNGLYSKYLLYNLQLALSSKSLTFKPLLRLCNPVSFFRIQSSVSHKMTSFKDCFHVVCANILHPLTFC